MKNSVASERAKTREKAKAIRPRPKVTAATTMILYNPRIVLRMAR